jgi:hypothetical protein
VPLDWALTQKNLGSALATLGERQSGTASLLEAVAAWNACLTVATSVWPAEWVHCVQTHRHEIEVEIERRSATEIRCESGT